jgi:hypothetical protein
MTPTEREHLVTGFLNGSLPEGDVIRFHALLVTDPELRELLAELAVQHARLGRLLKTTGPDGKGGTPSSTTLVAVRLGGPPPKPPPLSAPRPQRPRRRDEWLTAAVGTISSLLGSVLRRGLSVLSPGPRLRAGRPISPRDAARPAPDQAMRDRPDRAPRSSVADREPGARAARGSDLP